MLRLTQEVCDNKEDPKFLEIFKNETQSLLDKKGATLIIDPDLDPMTVAGFLNMFGVAMKTILSERVDEESVDEIKAQLEKKLGVEVQVIKMTDPSGIKDAIENLLTNKDCKNPSCSVHRDPNQN